MSGASATQNHTIARDILDDRMTEVLSLPSFTLIYMERYFSKVAKSSSLSQSGHRKPRYHPYDQSVSLGAESCSMSGSHRITPKILSVVEAIVLSQNLRSMNSTKVYSIVSRMAITP